MRLVEVEIYSQERQGEWPAHCLLEDEDGYRILLSQDPLPRQIMNEMGNAQMLVRRTDTGYAHELLPASDLAFVCQSLQGVSAIHLLQRQRESQRRLDAIKNAFVSIHTHTEFSALDGLTKVEELIDIVVQAGQPGVAVTDHGNCASHADLVKLALKKDIVPICGEEANWVQDRFVRENQYAYNHLILLAQNEKGLHNLWAASTEANRSGFYGRPRMDWEILRRYSEGLICSTACLRGPLSDFILADRVDLAKALLARFMDIFRDRLYLEIHSNTLPDQVKLNVVLAQLGQELSLPIIAAVDSHYPCAEDYDLHQLWLRAQTSGRKGDAKVEGGDDSRLFSGHQDYHLMTRAEVRAKLDYLPQAVIDEAMDNTVVLMKSVEPYNIVKSSTPMFAPDKGRKYATRRLLEICMANWDRKITRRRHSKPESVYRERFEYEMKILIAKEFTDYYMIVQDYVRWVKDRQILVGPGRGSGAASLVAYLADITEVDPLEFDLPFARFITIDRPDPPDFDLDFPTSKRGFIQDGITDRWGFEYVMRVGTHTRLKNKGAIKDMYRVLRDSMYIDYVDIEAICKIIDGEESDSAGLGKKWEEVMLSAEVALAPYIAKYPVLFERASRVVGRLKTYSKHAAGLVISTGEPLSGRLPMRRGADEDAPDDSEQMVAEFDFRALESMGLLKFDILTLRTLDTLQLCIDLIRERKGLVIDVYEWQEEFDDPQVWEAIGEGNTLGIFTFETPAMTEMIKRVRPQSIIDLAVINALGRPGPQRSGATELYLRRRAGQEQVVYDHPLMEEVTSSTYGIILFQEQVMRTTQVLAGFSDIEAEKVRKILGKKLKDEAAAKGEEFVKGCLEKGIEETIARHLWDQMATFSLYGFSICVTGDTRVHLAGANGVNSGFHTVEQMYRRLHGPMRFKASGRPKRGEEFTGPCMCCGAEESVVWTRGWCNACYVWKNKFLTLGVHALSLYDDGRIRPARMKDVVYSGTQEVFEILLENGMSISSTAEHQHLAMDGYRKTCDLRPGMGLVVDAGYEPTPKEEARCYTKLTGLEATQQCHGRVNGAFGPDNWAYTDGSWAIWSRWRQEIPRVCSRCGATPDEASIHCAHLDGNRQNNVPENYAWMCQSCHFKHDYAVNGRKGRYHRGHPSAVVPVVAITSKGLQETYDVVMADDPHNFVANGIVTHNCHSVPYAMLGWYCAWFRVHYPEEFFTSILSTVEKDNVPKFVNECKKLGFQILPPDINISKQDFTAHPMAVRYGLLGIKGVGGKAIEVILVNQPYSSFEEFREKMKKTPCDMGVIKTLAAAGAFDSIYPNRKQLEVFLEIEAEGEDTRCINKDPASVSSTDFICHFDWDSEPVEFTAKGKAKQRKPPPKRCTIGCRHYDPRGLPTDQIEPYTPAEIREKEMEHLGVWLSSTPFDRIPEEFWNESTSGLRLYPGSQVSVAPNGTYMIAGIPQMVKPHRDRMGNQMAFIEILAKDDVISMAVFSSEWPKLKNQIGVGKLGLYSVHKKDRRLSFKAFHPIAD
jgi:DNA polymerase-3 subunit alpha